MSAVITITRQRAQLAARAFVTPRRREQSTVALGLPGAKPFSVFMGTSIISGIEKGVGPALLLVHGWERQVSDFSSLIPVLLGAGYRVIAFDLPAHGASESVTASIPTCAEACMAMQQKFGEFHAVIGHSVGALIAAQATILGLKLNRAVAISAPARYEECARRFARQSELRDDEADEMIRALDGMGANASTISLPNIAHNLAGHALFIHSRDDRVVPFSDSLENAKAWSGAMFLQLDNLGHRRILNCPDVLRTIADFVRT
jgi:pimeloyl-ACP methyl ester carboxylesterase